MTRMVFCRKYKQELEGLDKPPLPGAKGQEIFDTISKRAWTEWQEHQTMLITKNPSPSSTRKRASISRSRWSDSSTTCRSKRHRGTCRRNPEAVFHKGGQTPFETPSKRE